MTPREKNWAQIASAIIAFLILLGGVFAFGASMVSNDGVLKTRVDTLEQKLERMEGKIDRLLERSK